MVLQHKTAVTQLTFTNISENVALPSQENPFPVNPLLQEQL